MAIKVIDPAEVGVPMPMIGKQAWLVVSPHMGARTAVMNVVELAPGEQNTPHVHPESEDSLFLLGGSGWAHDLDTGVSLPIEAGCAVMIPAGVRHTIEAGPDGIRSIGGPVPPDVGMLRAMGLKVV